MLTKEECLNSLDELILNWGYEGLEEDLEPIYQLINEHFDNPPFGFEELKSNMWVWDNEDKKYNKIIEINGDKISFYYITSDVMRYICKFEPNRFYRKEVHE